MPERDRRGSPVDVCPMRHQPSGVSIGVRRSHGRAHVLVSLMSVSVLTVALGSSGPAGAASLPEDVPTALVGPVIGGTITWTTVTQTRRDESNENGAGSLFTSTMTDTATIRVKLRRDGQSKMRFEVADAGSTFTSQRKGLDTILLRSYSGETNCSSTITTDTGASGAFLPADSDAFAPTLVAVVVPGYSPPTLGRKTKAISIFPVIKNSGTITETAVGSGTYPCESTTATVPLEDDATWTGGSYETCFPAGVNARALHGQGGLIGVWRQATKSFVFDCSQIVEIIDGTVTMTIKGTLRYG